MGVNRTLDEAAAEEIVRMYFEAVVAPDFTPEAVQILSRKKAIRLLAVRGGGYERIQDVSWIPYADLDFKRIDGGFLVQTRNMASDPSGSMQVVSKRQPTLEELTDLHFAWRAVKHVKSNAIVLAKKLALVGVGAGQMSRVNAVELACGMAEDRARGSVLASDAYFPFPGRRGTRRGGGRDRHHSARRVDPRQRSDRRGGPRRCGDDLHRASAFQALEAIEGAGSLHRDIVLDAQDNVSWVETSKGGKDAQENLSGSMSTIGVHRSVRDR